MYNIFCRCLEVRAVVDILGQMWEHVSIWTALSSDNLRMHLLRKKGCVVLQRGVESSQSFGTGLTWSKWACQGRQLIRIWKRLWHSSLCFLAPVRQGSGSKLCTQVCGLLFMLNWFVQISWSKHTIVISLAYSLIFVRQRFP